MIDYSEKQNCLLDFEVESLRVCGKRSNAIYCF